MFEPYWKQVNCSKPIDDKEIIQIDNEINEKKIDDSFFPKFKRLFTKNKTIKIDLDSQYIDIYLLKQHDKIPEEFKLGKTKWNRVIRDEYFYGISCLNWSPKSGTNIEQVLKVIDKMFRIHFGDASMEMAMNSKAYKTREAVAAYLLNEYFLSVCYKPQL